MVPLGQPDTSANILHWSPTARVPAYRDGDLVMWDSLAICEHLAETHPEAGLWPTDPLARGVARSVVAEMHSGFVPLRKHMPLNMRASYPGAGRDPGVEEDMVSRFTTYGVSPKGIAGDYMDAVWALPAMQEWTARAREEEWSVERYDQ